MTRAISFTLLSIAVLTAATTDIGSASAQDTAAADAAFREGRKLFKAGDHEAACAKFEQSFALDAATGTLLNLAACKEALGKTATAWATFNNAAERAKVQGRAAMQREAQARAAKLEPLLVRIRIESVAGQGGLIILRDGAVASELIGVAAPVDPGTHSFSASREGFRPWQTRVTVGEPGETTVVTIPALEPLPTVTALAEEKASPENAEAQTRSSRNEQPTTMASFELDGSRRTTRRRLALGVGLVGAVALASAAGTGLLARSSWNDSQANGCVEGRCTDAIGFEQAKRARKLGIATDVLAIVGTASVLLGATLWLTAPGLERTRVAVTVSPQPAGLALTAAGSF